MEEVKLIAIAFAVINAFALGWYYGKNTKH